jgi:16S rRNA (guanine527-N7)-methyltransferase
MLLLPMLSESTIAALLTPYLPTPPPALISQLQIYLDLLLRWNARTNLTAIREPEEIVRRHFGESLFCARRIAALQPRTLLDFGSGAGFPGLPIQLLLPDLKITLAESQGKKATFLREVIRTLNLSTELWPHRVETMPPTRQFDIVTLRAVDRMSSAIAAARLRIVTGGHLITFTTEPTPIPVPATHRSFLHIESGQDL